MHRLRRSRSEPFLRSQRSRDLEATVARQQKGIALRLCHRRLAQTPLQLPSRHSIGLVVLQYLFERLKEICVEWIRPIRRCGAIAPMLVHPQPGRSVLSHVRLKRIPTGLRDLLMCHRGGALDLRVKDDPVTSIRQRFAMRGDDRCAGLFMQPGVRGGHACF